MIDTAELELLRASALNFDGDGSIVVIEVNACAYSCCGRGWERRDGYLQRYRGWIDNLHIREKGRGTFMLYSPGIGTLSYVVAVHFQEVETVEAG